jgi:hypothetical protein
MRDPHLGNGTLPLCCTNRASRQIPKHGVYISLSRNAVYRQCLAAQLVEASSMYADFGYVRRSSRLFIRALGTSTSAMPLK